MKRHFAIGLVALCLFAVGASTVSAVGVAPSALVPERAANAVGLTRAWFAQAVVDVDREKATSATFQDGLLLITTDAGIMQAFDGETGASLWTVNVGDGKLLPPAVNSKIVAAICGTNLVVYDRFNGKKLDEVELYGNPSSGPVATEREIYTPLFSQRIHAFPLVQAAQDSLRVDAAVKDMLKATEGLENAQSEWAQKLGAANDSARYAIEPLKEKQPFSCASLGVSLVSPVVGTQTYPTDVVAWTTDQGWALVGQMLRRGGEDPFKLFYKLQARPSFAYVNEQRVGNRALIPRDDVKSSPFFLPTDESDQGILAASGKGARVKDYVPGGMFIVGSESGHVFAMNDISGALRWTYLTRDPVSERVAVFYRRPAEGVAEGVDPCCCAYVPTESGALFAVSLRTGRELWEASGIQKTIAASKTRLYAIDVRDRLAIVDRQDGKRLKSLDIGNVEFHVFNQENDRVYIVSSDGLIQCLRETQADAPVVWRDSCADINARLMGETKGEEEANGAADKNKAQAQAIDDEDDVETSAVSSGTPDDDTFASSADDDEDEEEEDSDFDDEE